MKQAKFGAIQGVASAEEGALAVSAMQRRPALVRNLYTADGQPINAAQLAQQLQVVDSMKRLFPERSALYYHGDLVDAGDNSRSPEYGSVNWGFKQWYDLWSTVCPVDRLFALSGNHDIDYNNNGQKPQHAGRMHEYLTWFDKLFFYSIWGNVLHIHMGAMARNTAGNITDYVMDWCKELVRTHQWCSIIEVHIHQPWQNTVNGSTSVGGSQTQSARWFAWAGNPGYRIDVVYSGHSGADFNNPAVQSEVIQNGVRYVALDMNAGVDPENPDSGSYDSSYIVGDFVDGATSVTYRRINAENDTISKTWTINTACPIQTAELPRHDGRTHSDSRHDIFTTKKQIFVTPDRVTADGGATWTYPTNVTVLELAAEDRNDEMEIGMGISVDFFLPGSNTGSSGNNTANINHSYGYSGRLRAMRTSGGERSFGSEMQLYAAINGLDSGGDEVGDDRLRMVYAVRPSNHRWFAQLDEGLQDTTTYNERMRLGQHLLLFRTSASLSNQGVGFCFYDNGTAVIASSGTAGIWALRITNAADAGAPITVGGIGSEATRTKFIFNANGAGLTGGAGSPEGVIAMPVGSVWMDITNGVQYNKKTGTGNTGWKLVTQAA